MADDLRVLHVISTLHTGGAEIQVASYVRELRRQGVHTEVCCIREQGHLYDALAEEGVPMHFLKFKSRWHPVSLWELGRLLRDRRITHVQGHMYRANVPVTAAGRLFGCPHVLTTIHDFWDNDRQRRMDGRLNFLRDRVLVVSEEKRRYYIDGTGIDPDKVVLFPSAIDQERARSGDPEAFRAEFNLTPETPVITMVARTAEPKDYPTFIRAADRILAERPEFRFFAVGDGNIRDQLEDQVAAGSAGLREGFRFLGTRMDVPDILAASSVVVLTSRREGLPLALLEAMAVGKPVVSNPVGGVPEVVRDGETGFLVDVGDDASLAERLLAIADGTIEIAPVVEAARRLVDAEYSLAARTRQLIDLYRAL